MKIQIVFAHGMSKSHQAPFGNKQSLPWKHNSTDLKHFKRVTDGTVLVMGSKTFESLPGKLPNRPHVVLSSKSDSVAKNGSSADCYLEGSMESIIESISEDYPEYDTISVIGGPSVIKDAIDYADVVYKSTILEHDLECDVTINLHDFVFAFPVKTDMETGDLSVHIEKLTKL